MKNVYIFLQKLPWKYGVFFLFYYQRFCPPRNLGPSTMWLIAKAYPSEFRQLNLSCTVKWNCDFCTTWLSLKLFKRLTRFSSFYIICSCFDYTNALAVSFSSYFLLFLCVFSCILPSFLAFNVSFASHFLSSNSHGMIDPFPLFSF